MLGDDERLFAQDTGTPGYIETGDETFAFPMDVFDFKEWDIELSKRISAAEEMGNNVGQLDIIWLCVAELDIIKEQQQRQYKPAHKI